MVHVRAESTLGNVEEAKIIIIIDWTSSQIKHSFLSPVKDNKKKEDKNGDPLALWSFPSVSFLGSWYILTLHVECEMYESEA